MKYELCPRCGGPMEAGKLRSRGMNFYLPEGQTAPAWFARKQMLKKRCIILPPDPLDTKLPPQWPAAYVCRSCKFLLIPYEEYE